MQNYSKITDEALFKELVNTLYNQNESKSASVKNALKLVLHLPLRGGNITSMKWSFIDFKKRVLTIPRYEMKMSNNNLSDYKVYLSDEVISILKAQKSFYDECSSNSEYVFISNDLERHIHRDSLSKALIHLGFIGDKKQSTHSFRGTFKTMLMERSHIHGVDDKIIKSVLDHLLDNKVGLAYSNKLNLIEQQRPLMKWWSDFVLSQLD